MSEDEVKWIYEPLDALLLGQDCCNCTTAGPGHPKVCQWLTDHLITVVP